MQQLSFARGWQLRVTRHLMPPDAVIDSTNLYPDLDFGALTTRLGQAQVADQSAPLGNLDVHSLATLYNINQATGVQTKVRYQAATNVVGGNAMSLYRGFTSFVTGLTPGFIDAADMRAFNDTSSAPNWIFFALRQVLASGMSIKDNGTLSTPYSWGVAAPGGRGTTTPGVPTFTPTLTEVGPLAGGGALSAGTYSVQYVYVREVSGSISVLGNPSLSAAQALNAGDGLSVTNIHNPADPADQDYDPQVTHIYLYRTIANGSTFLFDTKIAATGTGLLSHTLTQADTGLAEEIEIDNDPPPALQSICAHQEHLVGVTGRDNKLWFSKRFRPDAMPLANYLDVGSVGDILHRVIAFQGALYAFSRTHLWQVLGGPDETAWVVVETDSPVGLASDPASTQAALWTVARGQRGLYFLGNDGIYLFDGAHASNITDQALLPLFHGQTVNGFEPVRYAQVGNCVGGWFSGAYWLSYVTQGSVPTRTLRYDERSQTFWPDARGFRRFSYERPDELFLAGSTDGLVRALEYSDSAHLPMLTDDGAAIAWSLQTRDEDEQAPDSDKQFVQVITDVNTHSGAVLLSVVQDYGAITTPVATVVTSVRTQVSNPFGEGAIFAKALGYLLQGAGAVSIYRLVPSVIVLPPSHLAYDMALSNLGHRGEKRLEEWVMDIDLLEPGTVTMRLFDQDHLTLETVSLSDLGRREVSLMSGLHDVQLVGVSLRSTALFRLWQAPRWAFVALPPTRYVYNLPATGLGAPGMKIIQALVLDLELVEPGVFTATLLVDGVAQTARYTTTTPGRLKTGRLRQPRTAHGRLVEITLTSTGRWRLWGGELLWSALGQPEGLQRTPLVAEQPVSTGDKAA